MRRDRGSRAKSLKARTLVVIALIMTAIVSASDQVDLWRNRSERAEGLETRAMLVGAIQADALASPLWNLASDQVQVMVAALARDPDFLSAHVVGVDGKRVAAYSKSEASTSFIERKFEVAHTDNGKRERIGELTLRLSTAGIEQASKDQFQLSVIKLMIMLIIIIGAIYAALRLITTPLGRMTTAMSRLADGETDIEVPAMERRDEIGAMARAVSVFKTNAIARQRLETEQLEMKQRG